MEFEIYYAVVYWSKQDVIKKYILDDKPLQQVDEYEYTFSHYKKIKNEDKFAQIAIKSKVKPICEFAELFNVPETDIWIFKGEWKGKYHDCNSVNAHGFIEIKNKEEIIKINVITNIDFNFEHLLSDFRDGLWRLLISNKSNVKFKKESASLSLLKEINIIKDFLHIIQKICEQPKSELRTYIEYVSVDKAIPIVQTYKHIIKGGNTEHCPSKSYIEYYNNYENKFAKQMLRDVYYILERLMSYLKMTESINKTLIDNYDKNRNNNTINEKQYLKEITELEERFKKKMGNFDNIKSDFIRMLNNKYSLEKLSFTVINNTGTKYEVLTNKNCIIYIESDSIDIQFNPYDKLDLYGFWKINENMYSFEGIIDSKQCSYFNNYDNLLNAKEKLKNKNWDISVLNDLEKNIYLHFFQSNIKSALKRIIQKKTNKKEAKNVFFEQSVEDVLKWFNISQEKEINIDEYINNIVNNYFNINFVNNNIYDFFIYEYKNKINHFNDFVKKNNIGNGLYEQKEVKLDKININENENENENEISNFACNITQLDYFEIEAIFSCSKNKIYQIKEMKYVPYEKERLENMKANLDVLKKNNNNKNIIFDKSEMRKQEVEWSKEAKLIKIKEDNNIATKEQIGLINNLLKECRKILSSNLMQSINIEKRLHFNPTMTFIQNKNFKEIKHLFDKINDSFGIDTNVLNKISNIEHYSIRTIPIVYELWCLLKIIETLEIHNFTCKSKSITKMLNIINPNFDKVDDEIVFDFDSDNDIFNIKLYYQYKYKTKKRPDFILKLNYKDNKNNEGYYFVLDAKYKDFNENTILHELKDIKEKYNNDYVKHCFILHPININSFGGDNSNKHRFGYISMRPGEVHNLVVLIGMLLQWCLPVLSNDKKLPYFCIECGSNKKPNYGYINSRKFYYDCNCGHKTIYDSCLGCKKPLWKHNSGWDYHVKSIENYFEVKCPCCGYIYIDKLDKNKRDIPIYTF